MARNVLREQKPLWKRIWLQRSIQCFALAGMVYLIIFNVIPMVGLVISFKDYHLETGFRGMFTSNWIGFRHFSEFFHEYNFTLLLRNTVMISVLKLIFTFPVPIIFAIALNEITNMGIKRVVQTSSYMPYFISWVVVSGFCILFLNTQNGIVNAMLVRFGLVEKPFNFLANPNVYWTIAVVTGVWKEMGWWAILFLAAITGIDPELYEAAIIDGAGRIKRIRHITIPCILPTIMVVLILSIGNLFGGSMGGSNFDQSFLLGNAGNRAASDIIQTYVFRIGLAQGRYDYAAAVGLIQSVVSVILIFLSNKISKQLTGSGLY
ncbi:MAG: ABC transporter permease subunit [Spirochaetaceae bacterium]|jgi:putative aldouronate transport system permease protein|nr:ABC transporter permease subunit [Spirochaetaceae bacterium]